MTVSVGGEGTERKKIKRAETLSVFIICNELKSVINSFMSKNVNK